VIPHTPSFVDYYPLRSVINLYKTLAKYYDKVYSQKNYSDEVDKLYDIISRFKQSEGNRLLDVACGTGGHISYFKKYYDVVGCDLNQEMLEVAQKKHPEIPFIQADMTTLDFDPKFDVMTCLFGSISYLADQSALSSTMNSFARTLSSGGVMVIEPFLFWEDVIPNHVSMDTVDEPELKISRIAKASKKGMYLVLDFHFTIGTPDGIKYFHDSNRMFLFSKEMFKESITDAGLEYHYLKPEWARSGLVIGKKA